MTRLLQDSLLRSFRISGRHATNRYARRAGRFLQSLASRLRPVVGRRRRRLVAVERLEDRCLLTCLNPDNTCFAVIGDYGDAGSPNAFGASAAAIEVSSEITVKS